MKGKEGMSINESGNYYMYINKLSQLFGLTCSLFALISIGMIMIIISMKKKGLYKICSFILFLSVQLTCLNFREVNEAYSHSHELCAFTYMGMVCCCIYLMGVDSSFYTVLLSSCLAYSISWVIRVCLEDLKTMEIVWSTVFFLMITVISYLEERNNKIIFFYKWKILEKNKWFSNMLESIQNGLIVIDKNKIKYYNTFVSKNQGFLIELGELGNAYLNRHIFKGLEAINSGIPCDILEIMFDQERDIHLILEDLEKDEKAFFKDFNYIGIKRFQDHENENLAILEIFLRIVPKGNDETNFEFIFNDVTRSKLVEEAKAQITYKTLFLAKIAHEFKNPLIIIKELIDQIKEELFNIFPKNSDKILKNMNLVKNLSSYMLILVKDFEVISKKETTTKIDLNNGVINIRSEMSYLKGIVQSLIEKKYGQLSTSPVKFILTISPEVPDSMTTDKTRLSQILINLLSNAIKFTNRGYISLAVDYSQCKLKFTVADSGLGVPEQNVRNLFKTFFKTSDNNIYGSGLGLSIVSELCRLLGGEIKFDHNEPEGSIFFFELEINNHNTKGIEIDNSNFFNKSNKSEKIKNDLISDEDKSISKKSSFFNAHNKSLKTNHHVLNEDEVESSLINRTISQKKEIPFRVKHPLDEPKFNISRADSFLSINDKTIMVNNTNNTLFGFINQGTININSNQMMFVNSTFNHLNLKPTSFELSFYSCDDYFLKNNIPQFTKIYKSDKGKENSPPFKSLTILIVDDEAFIRKSVIRQLDSFFLNKNKNFELRIIEAADGIDCMYTLYSATLLNLEIDLVISDETMKHMSGSLCADILPKLQMNKIPFAIVTAYEGNVNKEKYTSPYICGVFTKPLNSELIEQLMRNAHIDV